MIRKLMPERTAVADAESPSRLLLRNARQPGQLACRLNRSCSPRLQLIKLTRRQQDARNREHVGARRRQRRSVAHGPPAAGKEPRVTDSTTAVDLEIRVRTRHAGNRSSADLSPCCTRMPETRKRKSKVPETKLWLSKQPRLPFGWPGATGRLLPTTGGWPGLAPCFNLSAWRIHRCHYSTKENTQRWKRWISFRIFPRLRMEIGNEH